MITNDSTALMKSPIRKRLPFTVKNSPEKSGTPPKAPIKGVTRSLTKAVTTAPNAAPITTATARSTTLPRRRNFLKPDMPLTPVEVGPVYVGRRRLSKQPVLLVDDRRAVGRKGLPRGMLEA